MRFLSFMSNSPDADGPDVEGLIDECGLRPAYNRIFNEEERTYIESRQGSFPLTRGAYIASHLGEFDMVSDLIQFSSQFQSSAQELHIAMRFHVLAASFLEIAGDWFAYHQVMQTFIPQAFSLRGKVPPCDGLTQEACEQHIRHTQQILGVLPQGEPLGSHAGYWHMCLLMDQRSKLESALHYARQGKAQGWTNEWDKRIADIERRLPTRQSDTVISPLTERLGHASPPPAARVVTCGGCGQRMRIPQSYTKPQGSCIKCGAVVPLQG